MIDPSSLFCNSVISRASLRVRLHRGIRSHMLTIRGAERTEAGRARVRMSCWGSVRDTRCIFHANTQRRTECHCCQVAQKQSQQFLARREHRSTTARKAHSSASHLRRGAASTACWRRARPPPLTLTHYLHLAFLESSHTR